MAATATSMIGLNVMSTVSVATAAIPTADMLATLKVGCVKKTVTLQSTRLDRVRKALLTSEALAHEFTQSHVHAALHPIPGEVVLVAAQLLEDNTNYQQVWHSRADGRRLRGIVFNSSEYNVCFGNADALPVTTSRTKTYMKSLQGHIPHDEKAVNIKIKYLSMYFVEINESIDIEPCNESPLRTEQEVSDDVSADF
ncbi:hypothetical protein H257_15728 [Aphanomyces astaci]|uniref:Uncharacterized protein n=1 Tax=Aphanomyces astaci TaxID=112090 RepID=W4FLB7_APHAT|nr:hypothetical protein H257_15728 [Aphanomyces astaci]ETV68280.1 hypothetical protein H257_15728 [Aphanomyces astaci]|eukprot:XP_009842223.1 hypothetical protein H257_15728 [Aphanomyces astaci]